MFQNFFKRALPLDVFCDVLKKKNILLTMPLTVLIAHLYWKVHYKICSWIPFKNPPEKNKLGDKNILEALPNVCAEEPVYGSAFCHKHKEVVASMGYPISIWPERLHRELRSKPITIHQKWQRQGETSPGGIEPKLSWWSKQNWIRRRRTRHQLST